MSGGYLIEPVPDGGGFRVVSVVAPMASGAFGSLVDALAFVDRFHRTNHPASGWEVEIADLAEGRS